MGGCFRPFFKMLKLVLILFIWRFVKRFINWIKNKNE
uniref:Uncharacterized protein n=1 Tax=Inoviridae sp. ctFNB4 TaxID=2823614 RepID=A0A8S5LBD2_9VIRU|nr:MAG TPA: hypothetical protein [Inoviridae sp. ctFNB4]